MSDVVSRAGLFDPSEAAPTTEFAEVRTLKPVEQWNPENFAREQIRGLVRQVFFANATPPVRQVVFSAVDAETEVRSICRQVAEALALETAQSVAVAGSYPAIHRDGENTSGKASQSSTEDLALRQIAIPVRGNLWLVPLANSISSASLHLRLSSLRREFEYSIVESPSAGASNEATTIAQMTDGIILVLSAQRTRRATARNIKERLEAARARILGTVLSNRIFPIPEKIYRRL